MRRLGLSATVFRFRRFLKARPPIDVETAYEPRRQNSLNAVRWFLAASVIYYHGYILALFQPSPIGRSLKLNVGHTAVLGFFVLSGFLIARSAKSSSGLTDFMWRRSLRIFPGYWVCLVATGAIVAPLSYRHNTGSFHGFRRRNALDFLVDNFWLRLHKGSFPKVFIDTAGARGAKLWILNGSLWTLRYEFICYCIVGVLSAVGLLWARRSAILTATVVLGTLNLTRAIISTADPKNKTLSRVLGTLIEPLADPSLARFIFAFLVGACFALYGTHILLDDRLGIVCIGVIPLIARWHGDLEILGAAPMLYAILWFGQRFQLRWWNRIGDPSYGVYIYGWPVQTLLAEWGLHRAVGINLYIVISILVSTVIGLISWHLIEKQAMRLKRYHPGYFFSVVRRRRSAAD